MDMSACSYGIVHRRYKEYVIVNAEFGDPLDVYIDRKPCGEKDSVKYMEYYDGIETVLFDDVSSPYRILRLLYTLNDNGSLATSRYLSYTQSGEAVDYVMDDDDYKSSVHIAKFVLWCECRMNNPLKAIKDALNISKLLSPVKDKEEICVICLQEYQVGNTIATLGCKHSYHEECITKWWMGKADKEFSKNCPICKRSLFIV